ncbi:hypothetical protein D6833_05755 [Candidatus Parcubacteria bacterium]|nr:MAG: hypothetical protein D6833_05755 [Candidatus Parcubacteria bacterium]
MVLHRGKIVLVRRGVKEERPGGDSRH